MEVIQIYWPVLLVTIPCLALFIEVLAIRYFVKESASLVNRITTIVMLTAMLAGIALIIEQKLLQPKIILSLLIIVILISTISLQLKSTKKKN